MSVSASHRPASTRRVLLVGWDGADWKIASPLIDAGEMPQLANIVSHGVSGPLASLPPYLSPMLWNSIATGKYADQHGILGFTTTDPVSGKLLPITSTQRRCKALWNILSERGLTAHVLGWFASHPAENVTGICVTEAFPRPVAKGAPWPLPPGTIHPPELAEEFADLRVRPEDIDHAILKLFVPRAAEIDLAKDRRLEQLAIRLAELYSVHNAAMAALDRGPCDFLAVYYHFIDWVCHDFMNFHPPRRAHIPEREFELYRDVVNSAYRLQDLLLRDLLEHAGPDTTVLICSDHGFHSDSRRPVRIPMVSAGIAIWHRAQGLFAGAGPGIARDVLVPGATLLDITPTILTLFGLPAADDLDGRVLTSALAVDTPVPKKIPSYETNAGSHPRPRHLAALSNAEEAALLDQFAALGYVDLADHGPESPAARNDRDNRWNLAITLRHAGKHEAALALLDRLHLELPEDPRYALHLAICQLHLGLADEAAATAETLLDFTPGNAQAHLLLAEIALARKDAEAAIAHLDAILGKSPSGNEAGLAGSTTISSESARNSSLLLLRGQALFKLGQIPEACAALRAAIEGDTENPAGWFSYAQALLRVGQPVDAETCARQCIALAPTLAAAHFTLGAALAAQKKSSEAGAAYARATELNPRLAVAARAIDQLVGRPFVAEVSDLTEQASTSNLEALHRESSRRRADYAATLTRLRSDAQPLTRFTPSKPPAATDSPLPPSDSCFIIVSGLPRSGTSLMMQMLARGGLAPMTDGRRPADGHNPEGYFEWEEIKNLPRDPNLVTRTAGHVVKVVSPLLSHLPARYRYKIIFMSRPAAEIARSQHRMRSEPGTPSVGAMQPLLNQHASATLTSLRAAKNIELLVVDYPALVADPLGQSQRVAEFLGADLLPRADTMPSAVRPELRREKEPSP